MGGTVIHNFSEARLPHGGDHFSVQAFAVRERAPVVNQFGYPGRVFEYAVEQRYEIRFAALVDFFDA